MKPEEMKRVVSRIADEMWNRGDLAVADEVMERDAPYHGPHMPNGVGDRETWRQAIGMYLGAFPDSQVSFDELLVSGDTVVGRWSATATHTGSLRGLGPTGRRIVIGGITIYRMAGSKIVESWEQLDMLGMWQQLGVVNLGEGA